MKKIQFENTIEKKRSGFLSEYSIISGQLDVAYKVKVKKVVKLDSNKMRSFFSRLFSIGK
jgi:hypothetical protein